MTYAIVLAPDAAGALKRLSTPIRTGLQKAIERHLRHEPTKVSKSRIKRLRGLRQPQYRLRIDDIRVFYDVTETRVEILAIVTKAEAQAWLDEQGTSAKEPAEGGGAGGSER
jgi:mRNA interferase RelE/StbE